jgi:hypothetical protein
MSEAVDERREEWMDEFNDIFDPRAAGSGTANEAREHVLYRLVILGQNLVVRLNGLYPDALEDEYLL